MATLIAMLIGVAGFVAAYVFHLQSRNTQLTNELGQSKADNKLTETLTEEKMAHKETEDVEKDYNDLRTRILNNPTDGASGSDTGSTVH